MLCKQNPNKRCTGNFAHKYWVGDKLLAKCEGEIQVRTHVARQRWPRDRRGAAITNAAAAAWLGARMQGRQAGAGGRIWLYDQPRQFWLDPLRTLAG